MGVVASSIPSFRNKRQVENTKELIVIIDREYRSLLQIDLHKANEVYVIDYEDDPVTNIPANAKFIQCKNSKNQLDTHFNVSQKLGDICAKAMLDGSLYLVIVYAGDEKHALSLKASIQHYGLDTTCNLLHISECHNYL